MTQPNDTIPEGLCRCGCGQQTTIYRGKSRRFIAGHQWRVGPDYIVEDRGYKTPCHIWQRGRSAGYGYTCDEDGNDVYAHVLAYRQAYGPVPKGKEVDHLCRVRLCRNPDHLEAVTHAVNVRRATSLVSDDDIREIFRLRGTLSYAQMGQRFGVHRSTIAHIIRRRRHEFDPHPLSQPRD